MMWIVRDKNRRDDKSRNIDVVLVKNESSLD